MSSKGLAQFISRRAERYLNCPPENNENFIKTKSSDISSLVNAMKVKQKPTKKPKTPTMKKTNPKAQTERKTAYKKGENKCLW